MAVSLLSEEKLQCSVCLDVFTEPVTTSCGHTFCTACIYGYWDSCDVIQCPLCKREFSQKPDLLLNTVMSELAAEFKALVQVKPSTPDPELPPTADVLCDICSDMKQNAVKSCLTCLASFCEVHLEPHRRVAGLKSHTLLDPVKDLDERMCKAHSKVTELYCRTDRACVCVSCIKTEHKGHDVVSLEEEHEAATAKKDETMANIQKMVRSRHEKMTAIETAAGVCREKAEREKEDSVQVFGDLISAVQASQTELVEVIEERCVATKRQADGFLAQLRTEVAELQSRSSQLEELSRSEDRHRFLRSFAALCSPPNPDWADWADVAVRGDLSFVAVRDAAALLRQRVDEMMAALPEIKMKRMREHAVDLTFDPDTAFCSLVVSPDGKQVTNSEKKQKLPPEPKRFGLFPEVLAKEGFAAGKFYYEVQVKGKMEWVVGVVGESVNRKDKGQLVKNAFWTIGLNERKCEAHASPIVVIALKEALEKLGVFVDYDQGEVSFYDVNSKSHLYSFTGHRFTETLYPYFCTQYDMDGANSAPLVITPVPQALRP